MTTMAVEHAVETPHFSRKRGQTRERILDVATTAVLEKGFAATSIEELIVEVGITKSGFFYHFKDKSALAHALLERYIAQEEVLLDQLFDRANELHDDPLHAFLIGLKLFEEMMADLPGMHPGCLIAAFCYQDQLFDQKVRDLNSDAVLRWRRRFRDQLNLIVARYPPKLPVDLDALADMVSALVDGGIILSKAAKEREVLPAQVKLYRQFVQSVFLGT